MDRRKFVKQAAVGAVGGGLLAGCVESGTGPAIQTHPILRWRLTSSYPPALDTIFGAAEHLAERVSQLTDGRFTIRVFPPNEIVPGLQVFDAVQQGTVEMGHTASYYYIGKHPAFAFDTTIPFGLTARQQTAWVHEGGGMDLLRGHFSDFNILNFPGGNTGVQMGGWFRHEINSREELKGVKMRIPGMGGEVMNQLGVTVQVLAGGDIYPALERGAIDATEWVGPYDDEKLGFYRAAKFYYYPGWWEPGPTLSFYINKDAWNGIPTVYQEALKTAMIEADQGMLAKYDARNPAALQRLLGRGVKLRRFSDDIMEAAEKEMAMRHDASSASHPEYKRIFEQWDQFRKDTGQWLGTAEQAFAAFAFR